MCNTVAEEPAAREDTYSIGSFRAGDTPDLEQRIWHATAPGLPVIEIVTKVPQLWPANLDEFYEARRFADTRAAAGGRRGQPRRHIYVVSEVAYQIDIEQRPRNVPPMACGWQFDVLSYVAPGVSHGARLHLHDPERGLRRWLRDGRRTLHDLGAWPWAVVPEGVLGPRWWQEQQFQDVLDLWRQGVVLMPTDRAATDESARLRAEGA